MFEDVSTKLYCRLIAQENPEPVSKIISNNIIFYYYRK